MSVLLSEFAVEMSSQPLVLPAAFNREEGNWDEWVHHFESVANIWSRFWRYVQTTFLSGTCMQVNRNKTEHARIYLAPKGSPGHGNEAWRQMKTLGSRLDSAVDEQARINLAQLSMRKLHGMWGASKVNLALTVRL